MRVRDCMLHVAYSGVRELPVYCVAPYDQEVIVYTFELKLNIPLCLSFSLSSHRHAWLASSGSLGQSDDISVWCAFSRYDGAKR